MYKDYITTQDEAVCHLFLHCCFKDGKFLQDEINSAASKFVDLQIHRDLNFKEELQHYQTYKPSIDDETTFLQYLLKLINPVFFLYRVVFKRSATLYRRRVIVIKTCRAS